VSDGFANAFGDPFAVSIGDSHQMLVVGYGRKLTYRPELRG
jgi:hypothetical protein